MIEVIGLFNKALCYTDQLDNISENQIKAVCDREEFMDSKIRIMPDVHAGKGCTIGTTMTITDKIVPGMVGVDIGCGMETVKLAEKEIDYAILDSFIRSEIPCGREIRKTYHPFNEQIVLEDLRCVKEVKIPRARLSIGTLGGGNHFIEVARADCGDLYLIVHSGSRHIGSTVAEYYQNQAYCTLCGNSKKQIKYIIETLKAEGRHKEIDDTVQRVKLQQPRDNIKVPKHLSYVSGELFDDYMHDMNIIQQYAVINRKAMTDKIINGMGLTEVDRFTTIHNYIDADTKILRKGAVSAKDGERLLIPINMRDGSLICVGKGNEDWNYSAPHGAGRLMSRTKAFETLSMDEFKSEMNGIFTTSVNRDTLDESPMAYKSIDVILKHIAPTANIIEHIRTTYNFKASE